MVAARSSVAESSVATPACFSGVAFTTARMAKDYVSTYRQLLKMRSSNGKNIESASAATCSQWRQWPNSRLD